MLTTRSLFTLFGSATLVAPCFAQQPPAPAAHPPAIVGSKTTPGSKKPAVAAKPATKSNPVYACKDCKMAYSHNAAKELKMKDPMGHALVKMDKLPDGFKMQTKADLKPKAAAPTKSSTKKM